MSKVGHDNPPAMGSTTFAVSVLRCKQTGEVLFLEAGKDFVDTIFSFLLLPVGTIIHMLSNGPVAVKPWGGISSIYESVKNLDSSLLHLDKQTLMQPKPATCQSIGLLLEAENPGSGSPHRKTNALPSVYYRCESGICTSLSAECGRKCREPSSNKRSKCQHYYEIEMSVCREDLKDLEEAEAATVKASSSSDQGFVQENITYMVTDSLEIMPSTTIRSIKVLNQLKVGTLADLESNDITVTIIQVLQLLHSALTSKRCLNDVFGKK